MADSTTPSDPIQFNVSFSLPDVDEKRFLRLVGRQARREGKQAWKARHPSPAARPSNRVGRPPEAEALVIQALHDAMAELAKPDSKGIHVTIKKKNLKTMYYEVAKDGLRKKHYEYKSKIRTFERAGSPSISESRVRDIATLEALRQTALPEFNGERSSLPQTP